jgi:hypothetical protein
MICEGHEATWRVMPNGDRCCSHCGSLHEDDFIAIIEAYGNGEAGYRFDPSTKTYKRYAYRPGVQNASQGGIKFYGWHVSKEGPEAEFKRRCEIHYKAMQRWRAEMAKHLDTKDLSPESQGESRAEGA